MKTKRRAIARPRAAKLDCGHYVETDSDARVGDIELCVSDGYGDIVRVLDGPAEPKIPTHFQGTFDD